MIPGQSRPKLLFIAPIMPSDSGNGLAIRAGALLDAWSSRFDVTLYVVPAAGLSLHPTPFAVRRTARIGVLDRAAGLEPQAALIERVLDPAERQRQRLAYPRPWMARYSGERAFRHMMAWLGRERFDVLHVMRLYLAPLALRFLRETSLPAILDLDEDDARVHGHLARLHERTGQRTQAMQARAETRHYTRLAESSLGPDAAGLFRAVLTSSATEAHRLAARWPGTRLAVVPNLPASVRPARRRRPAFSGLRRPLRLLLVGSFGYGPNVDAARHMVCDVLPLLRRQYATAELAIVGSGGLEAMLGPGGHRAGVTVRGFVQDLGSCYAEADIAVVPLRVGGGTRIKILEAFAHRVPVVATSIGAEGLHAANGRHLLLADGPADFVQACMRLHRCAALRRRLVEAAASLRMRRYGPACVASALDTVMQQSP